MIPTAVETPRDLIIDKLIDAMFDLEEASDALRHEMAANLRHLDPALRSVFGQLDAILQQLCD